MKSQTMMHFRLALALCGIALAMGFLAPRASASEWDKRTIVTVSQPIEVQDTVLQPGTYVFKLLDSIADRHVVQIFNGDQSHIINTILAIPAERRVDQETGDTDFTFWETPAGYARAMRNWYHPGDTVGQEFRYPKHLSPVETASLTTSAPAAPTATPAVTPEPSVNETSAKTEAQRTTPEPEKPAAVAQTPTPSTAAPQPTQSATPQPAQPPDDQQAAPNDKPAVLPKTGSPYPLVALSGLLSLALYGILRWKRRPKSLAN